MTHKETKGKPRLGLLPYEALAKAARVREFGIAKYGDDECWKYVESKDFLEAALRHIHKHLSGEKVDNESGLGHIDHALASLILAAAVVEYEIDDEFVIEFDDEDLD